MESQGPEFKSQLSHFLAKGPPTNYSDSFQHLRSIPKQSTSRVMYECFIIFNMNLKTRTTGIEKAFPGMPSGFYSGMCSDSPCQQGRLPPLCTTQRGGGGNRTNGEAGTHLSHWANSLSLALDTQSHPRGRHPAARKTPTQPQTGLLA